MPVLINGSREATIKNVLKRTISFKTVSVLDREMKIDTGLFDVL